MENELSLKVVATVLFQHPKKQKLRGLSSVRVKLLGPRVELLRPEDSIFMWVYGLH